MSRIPIYIPITAPPFITPFHVVPMVVRWSQRHTPARPCCDHMEIIGDCRDGVARGPGRHILDATPCCVAARI